MLRSTALPRVLTHNYDPARGAFRNLCALGDDGAEAVLTSIRTSGLRNPKPNYLERRRRTERWLADAARQKLGRLTRELPIYFFLGDFADGLDPSRPASIRIPLEIFPHHAITFTYPDSMASWALLNDSDLEHQRRPHHGTVFTRPEVENLVETVGLPEPRPFRTAGALSDGFIEAQVWDAAPLEALLGREVPPS